MGQCKNTYEKRRAGCGKSKSDLCWDGSTVTETVLMGEKMPSCKYAPNVGLYLKVTSNADMADGECLYLDDISMKEVTVDNFSTSNL